MLWCTSTWTFHPRLEPVSLLTTGYYLGDSCLFRVSLVFEVSVIVDHFDQFLMLLVLALGPTCDDHIRILRSLVCAFCPNGIWAYYIVMLSGRVLIIRAACADLLSLTCTGIAKDLEPRSFLLYRCFSPPYFYMFWGHSSTYQHLNVFFVCLLYTSDAADE